MCVWMRVVLRRAFIGFFYSTRPFTRKTRKTPETTPISWMRRAMHFLSSASNRRQALRRSPTIRHYDMIFSDVIAILYSCSDPTSTARVSRLSQIQRIYNIIIMFRTYDVIIIMHTVWVHSTSAWSTVFGIPYRSRLSFINRTTVDVWADILRGSFFAGICTALSTPGLLNLFNVTQTVEKR